jgi:hypothetical protein
MQASQLPAYPEIEARVMEHLDRARAEMSDIRDWLRSDWEPAGSPRPDGAAEAASQVMTAVGEVKILIDQAKNALERR